MVKSAHPRDVADTFDFIVLGGGAGGNTVAGRLAENSKVKVLVVEAGPGDPENVDIVTTPARAMETRGSQYDWWYKTTMINREDYTRIECPNTRGKILGGSTSLNYFTWLRGSAATYDQDWTPYGGSEWSWAGVKDYFNKSAKYHDDKGVYDPGFKKLGENGTLPIAHADLLPETKGFRDSLQKAWKSVGRELTVNVYDGTQGGLFPSVNTVYNGLRSTSATAIEGKANVTVVANTTSKRILFKDKTAIGVEVVGPEGREYKFFANREVIVAQGVYESAKILMLSGIGAKEYLETFSIQVRIDSPHVGQNLQDHPIFPHVFKLKDGYGLDDILIYDTDKKRKAAADYKKNRTGPLTSPLLELVGFPRIDEYLAKVPAYVEYKKKNGGKDPFGPAGQPHFELDFVPVFADAFQWHFPTPPSGNYVTVIVDLMRPLSHTGTVKLNSTDPFEQPHINLGFLQHDLDIVALREGTRFIGDLFYKGAGMKDIVEGDYPWPLDRSSDEVLDKQILERSQTGFHPCGTNRMARDIGDGVVDPHLRVHGLKNLRVADASIFPVIPDCRIQNVVYMVAEKGADFIKQDHPDLYK
ncbi:Oxygen-dependent choline dehydrogenase [Vanrija pseudolonga]|uniref:Oxygen-dependent choline dehydrogenase n=1 Tax=Vanrija pseudolonga TaxID=143232 RepID=A0AAF0YGK4_9TREE|nr:Oxygen-dependent choline dehydrogenase [Vanrija pseudolonga]